MGKSAWDLAALLSSMVVPHTDYTQYIAIPNDSLSSYRLGVARGPGFFPFSYSSGLKNDPHSGFPQSEALFADALRVLAPAIALDPAEIPGSETIWERGEERSCFEDGKWMGRREVLLMVTDMYEDFNTYLAGLRNTSIRTLEDLVGWNKLHPVSTCRWAVHIYHELISVQDQAFPAAADRSTAQMFLEYAVETKGIKGEEYAASLEIGNAVAESFVDTLDKHHLDAMVFPTWSWAPGVASTGGFPIVSVTTTSTEQACSPVSYVAAVWVEARGTRTVRYNTRADRRRASFRLLSSSRASRSDSCSSRDAEMRGS
jgi:hypothetical protein